MKKLLKAMAELARAKKRNRKLRQIICLESIAGFEALRVRNRVYNFAVREVAK